MMKITMLLAGVTSKIVVDSLKIIENVLVELDIEIHKVKLDCLPYYDGNKNTQSEAIMKSIRDSKGVIAITSIPLITMHGAMQSFFDMASLYDEDDFDKPLLAISYSDSIGEQEVANTMLRCWSVLGGREGGKIYLNSQINMDTTANMLEREVEDFYRIVKQQRLTIKSSEYMIFRSIKKDNTSLNMKHIVSDEPNHQDSSPKIRTFADVIKNEINTTETNISDKSQTIKEITSRIKKDSARNNNKEIDSEDGFKEFGSAVYTKPIRVNNNTKKSKKVDQIPHYFIAQHETDLDLVLKYSITNDNETAYIVIRDGDCVYTEEVSEPSTVELIVSEEVLEEIITKKITYQKAFMLGKLKVKGNFAVLPKIDKIFK